MLFFRLVKTHFKGLSEIDRDYNNVIFGIGESKNEEYYISDYKRRANMQKSKTAKLSDDIHDMPQGFDLPTQEHWGENYEQYPYQESYWGG